MNSIIPYQTFFSECFTQSLPLPINDRQPKDSFFDNIRYTNVEKKYVEDLGYLDLVSSPNNVITHTSSPRLIHALCNSTYSQIHGNLKILHVKYPHIINEIHGNGFQVGLKISCHKETKTDFGLFLSEFSEQGQLVLLICSYLFSEHNIIATPMSSNSDILLITVPETLPNTEVKRFLNAIKAVIDIILLRRTDLMVRHLLEKTTCNRAYIEDFSCPDENQTEPSTADSVVAVVVHPHAASDIIDIDPSLLVFGKDELVSLISLFQSLLKPFYLKRKIITANEERIVINLIFIPALSEFILNMNHREIGKLMDGVIVEAHNSGAQIIGVSPHMSIALNKAGLRFKTDIPICTGEAYANLLLDETIRRVLTCSGMDLDKVDIFVLGKDGNLLNRLKDTILRECGTFRCGTQLSEKLNADVVIIIPSEEIHKLSLDSFTKKTIIVDLFGSTSIDQFSAAKQRGVLCVNGGKLCIGQDECNGQYFMSEQGGVAIVEAILFGLDGNKHSKSGDNTKRLATIAEKYHAELKHLHWNMNPITQGDWYAFNHFSTLNSGYLYNLLPTTVQSHVFHPPVNVLGEYNTNFCNYIFSGRKSKYESGKALINPNSGEAITYYELHELVIACSRNLNAMGYRKGDRVAVLAIESIQSVAAMVACLWSGLVFVPINHNLPPSSIDSMLLITEPVLILYAEIVFDELQPILCNYHSCEISLWFLSLKPAVETDESDVDGKFPLQLPSNSIAAILFTSGSTGMPKAVEHTHADLIHLNMNYTTCIIDMQAGERVYTPSRIFFAYGLNCILMSLFFGAVHILAAPLEPPLRIEDILNKYAINIFFSVPVVFKMIIDNNNHIKNLKLRLCISAGETLPATLYHKIRDFFQVEVLDGIGTTEVLSTFISNRPGYSRPGCTGMLVPGFEVKLINENGEICRVGEVGTLWVKGLTLPDCYLRDNEISKEMFSDSWFKTNDLFFTDVNNRFYCVGRVNNTQKINGIWFSPKLLEQALLEHPNVKDCAICMVKDEYNLPRPKAFVVLNRKVTDLPAFWKELKILSKERFGKHHFPHMFELIEKIPRTGSGKIKSAILLEHL